MSNTDPKVMKQLFTKLPED